MVKIEIWVFYGLYWDLKSMIVIKVMRGIECFIDCYMVRV